MKYHSIPPSVSKNDRTHLSFQGTEYEIDAQTGAVKIPLFSKKRPGLFALVDVEDVPLVTQYRWNPLASRATFYASTQVRTETKVTALLMHRLIMGVTDPKIQVDHINHDGLDNRRSKIRVVTNQQNQFNRRPMDGFSSKYKGVSFDKRDGRWEASLVLNQTTIPLGRYRNEELAARMYDQAAHERFGEYALLNLPLDKYRLEELIAEDEASRSLVGYGAAYGKSSFRGVAWWEKRGKWHVSITYQGRRHFLGLFDDEVQAARAYDERAKELHPRIPLNFPEKSAT